MNDVPLKVPTSKYKPHVAVIGAGVAGMTAAQELAERGFAVVVYEEHDDPLGRPNLNYSDSRTEQLARLRLPPHVGGLAATQWCRVPDPKFVDDEKSRPSMMLAQPASPWRLAQPGDWNIPTLNNEEKLLRIWERRWPLIPFSAGDDTVGIRWDPRISQIVDRLIGVLERKAGQEVLAVGGWVSADECTPEDPGGEALALRRAQAVVDALAAEMRKEGRGWESNAKEAWGLKCLRFRKPKVDGWIDIYAFGLGVEPDDTGGRLRETQRCVEIRIMDMLLPAEHGYRFFPSFYHHVFDTMRRIPLMERRTADVFRLAVRRDRQRRGRGIGPVAHPREPSSRTVFDNLRSVELHAFGGDERYPLRALPRSNTMSMRAMLELLDTIQQQAGVSARDIARGQMRTLRFLTSCAQRREQYERMTWWEFVGAEQGSAEFQALLVHWPQALVGLRAQDADARTFGTVLMQLLLDQLRPGGYRDGTLNGPTSEAWLDPWRAYLEDELDVAFHTCRVDDIKFIVDPTGDRIDVQLQAFMGKEEVRPENLRNIGPIEYIVVATSADAAAKLARTIESTISRGDAVHKDALLAKFDASPLRAAMVCAPDDNHKTAPSPGGSFRHFAGIQYFMDADYAPLRGHVYYPKSAWRLSSVSQAQFRQDRPEAADGYSGVISVVIGAWDVPGNDGKCAWDCKEEEIAEEVWRQMMASIVGDDDPPTRPRRFWIDENIVFGERMDREGQLRRQVVRNAAPFLVNLTAQAQDFPERPGRYEVHFDHLVFAGTYVRTHTRLVTMEAANESARHAVNAILRHRRRKLKRETARQDGSSVDRGVVGQDCEIFDPEARELEDLALLKRLDEELVARGLPHMLDILGVEDIALDLAGEGGGAATVLGAFRRLGDSSGGILLELVRFIRDRLSARS